MSHKIPNVKLRPAAPASAKPYEGRGKKRVRETSPLNAIDAEIIKQAWEGGSGVADRRVLMGR
jgi:hypothetical protein